MEILKIPPQVIPYAPVLTSIMSGCLNRTPNYYYGMYGASSFQGTKAMVVNKLYTIPFLVLAPESFNQILISVQIGAVGNGRLGIYASTTNNQPGDLILDAGEVVTDTAGLKAITINTPLNCGLYWLAAVFSGTPTLYTNSVFVNLLGIGGVDTSTNCNISVYYTDFAFDALPSVHPAPVGGNISPCIFLRRA